MIVSWNWLQDYVTLEMPPAELEQRLAMSGLNHEGTESVGDDLAIDLEVTSNRPDCLGHLGVAREISVLWDMPLKRPELTLSASSAKASESIAVSIEAAELCSQYSARIIRGVKVGPSPDWLVDRLATLGVAPVNNIVDITNYVLFECGQPLHAFDLNQLEDGKIIVRRATKGETLEAIDHNTYELTDEMCVIADASRPVAIAGVMGGAPTEVGEETTDLLIESAEFAQLPTRNTARTLKLDSPSSHRFERGVDPQGIDWASQRCCQLILEIAGGELEQGAVVDGAPRLHRDAIVLRMSEVGRVLGIEVNMDEIRQIIESLGFEIVGTDASQVTCNAPSWRRDCTREIDLIEEVARIHGYDKIPEDARVPMTSSHRLPFDILLDRVRQTLVAAGYFEAMTVSVVPEKWNDCFNPWTSQAKLCADTPMLEGAHYIRHSMIPSLLNTRRYNDSRGNHGVSLFEVSRIFINPKKADRPTEPWTLALISSCDFREMKGVLELIAGRADCQLTTAPAPTDELIAPARSAELLLNGKSWGLIGEVSDAGLKQFKLKHDATVAELNLEVLFEFAKLIPQDQQLSELPAMNQDLNFIVPESLTWAELEAAVRKGSGELLESLHYKETYRDPKQDGDDRKRVLLNVVLRSISQTLTKAEAEDVRNRVVAEVEKLDGKLVE